MKESPIAFFCGVLFSIGLALSGMTQPGKVVGFLDLFGSWDPSLAFVMMGAILVYSIGFRIVTKRKMPLISGKFQVPAIRKVDKPVIFGSILFGLGWGLIGFCPGPAVVSLATLRLDAILFVAFMIVGMVAFKSLEKRRKA